MLPVKDSGGFADACRPLFICILNATSSEDSTTCISSFWQHGVVARAWILTTDKILNLLFPIMKFRMVTHPISSVQFSSVTQSCLTLCDPWNAARQASLSITTSRIYSNSRLLSWWCHPAISSSVVPFSSCSQSLPASKSFPMSQLFAWGGQSTGVSALASFLPKNNQGWSPLEWTGWSSLQSMGLSRVFSNTTVQKHQFFGAQPSSQSNSHIHTWILEKP